MYKTIATLGLLISRSSQLNFSYGAVMKKVFIGFTALVLLASISYAHATSYERTGKASKDIPIPSSDRFCTRDRSMDGPGLRFFNIERILVQSRYPSEYKQAFECRGNEVACVAEGLSASQEVQEAVANKYKKINSAIPDALLPEKIAQTVSEAVVSFLQKRGAGECVKPPVYTTLKGLEITEAQRKNTLNIFLTVSQAVIPTAAAEKFGDYPVHILTVQLYRQPNPPEYGDNAFWPQQSAVIIDPQTTEKEIVEQVMEPFERALQYW